MDVEALIDHLTIYGMVQILNAGNGWHVRVCIDDELHTPYMIDRSLKAALEGQLNYCRMAWTD